MLITSRFPFVKQEKTNDIMFAEIYLKHQPKAYHDFIIITPGIIHNYVFNICNLF
jgi:hypothetical protein